MTALAAENPEEVWLAPDDEEKFEPQEWHNLYFQAFDLLQFDRTITASGQELPLFYQAISRYCEDFGIIGDDRRRFIIFINTVDGEYLKFVRERAEQRTKPKDDAPNENA